MHTHSRPSEPSVTGLSPFASRTRFEEYSRRNLLIGPSPSRCDCSSDWEPAAHDAKRRGLDRGKAFDAERDDATNTLTVRKRMKFMPCLRLSNDLLFEH